NKNPHRALPAPIDTGKCRCIKIFIDQIKSNRKPNKNGDKNPGGGKYFQSLFSAICHLYLCPFLFGYLFKVRLLKNNLAQYEESVLFIYLHHLQKNHSESEPCQFFRAAGHQN